MAELARPVRVTLRLPIPVADALTRLAIREDRTFERQAVRLLIDGLQRADSGPKPVAAGEAAPTSDGR